MGLVNIWRKWTKDFGGCSEAQIKRALGVDTLAAADLRRADLRRADLRRANLRGADLRGVKNVTVGQLSKAFVDENTKLPEGITLAAIKKPGEKAAVVQKPTGPGF